MRPSTVALILVSSLLMAGCNDSADVRTGDVQIHIILPNLKVPLQIKVKRENEV